MVKISIFIIVVIVVFTASAFVLYKEVYTEERKKGKREASQIS